MHRKKWIVLFSQTGSEIADICSVRNRYPDLILSNVKNKERIKDNYIRNNAEYLDHSDIMEYLMSSDMIKDANNTVVTLHGYLRILPDSVCNAYEIYNGHPGYIIKYPELRGLNPQNRTWENIDQYPTIGSVVHRVISEVDAGEVVSDFEIENNCKSLDELFTALKYTSKRAWEIFLEENQL